MTTADDPWRFEWKGDGRTGTATHLPTGLQVWVSRSGMATVARQPASVSADQARILMHEAMTLAWRPGVVH